MNAPVAIAAERYQVLLGILAGVATELLVMHFQVGHCTANLAFPGVTPEHLIAEVRV